MLVAASQSAASTTSREPSTSPPPRALTRPAPTLTRVHRLPEVHDERAVERATVIRTEAAVQELEECSGQRERTDDTGITAAATTTEMAREKLVSITIMLMRIRARRRRRPLEEARVHRRSPKCSNHDPRLPTPTSVAMRSAPTHTHTQATVTLAITGAKCA